LARARTIQQAFRDVASVREPRARGSGMMCDAALDAEERLVDKYSLASKHPYRLNMIPGGLAGLKQARCFLRDL